jgi:hypothetical protein
MDENIGDTLTFKMLKNDLGTVLQRSVARSAADIVHRNKHVCNMRTAKNKRKLISEV